MAEYNPQHDIKVLKTEVKKLDGMLTGIQDHYRRNLTRMQRDMSETLDVVVAVKDRLDREVIFLDSLGGEDDKKEK